MRCGRFTCLSICYCENNSTRLQTVAAKNQKDICGAQECRADTIDVPSHHGTMRDYDRKLLQHEHMRHGKNSVKSQEKCSSMLTIIRLIQIFVFSFQ